MSAGATTYVYSAINSDTTWTASSSPYVIDSNVHIESGATLTIEEGTIIKFNDRLKCCELNVFSGGLVARGTEANPIIFTSIKDDSAGGDTNEDGADTTPSSQDKWYLKFGSGNRGSIFEYVEIRNSLHGLSLEYTDITFDNVYLHDLSDSVTVRHGNVVMRNSLVADVFNGIFVLDESSLIVDDSEFNNIAGGGVGAGNDSHMIIARSVFNNAPVGLNRSDATITDSVMEASDTAGIQMGGSWANPYKASSLSLVNSIIRNNTEAGIHVAGGSLTVTGTEISDNAIGVHIEDMRRTVYVSLPVSAVISESDIFDNAEYGIEASRATGGIDARNNWWGDNSGPLHTNENPEGTGNAILGTVLFDPWEGQVAPCCSSVLFLPGLEASRLYVQGSVLENQLWDPNRTADVEALFLDENGDSITTGVYTRDVIDEAFGFNIYKNFISFMDSLTEGDDPVINEWRYFPYDWRSDIRDVLTGGSSVGGDGVFEHKNLVDELIELADGSRTGKVTIIAHSNGGLLGKLLISELEARGRADLVDKFIMVAVPQLGTPSALTGLLHGEELALPKKLGILMSES